MTANRILISRPEYDKSDPEVPVLLSQKVWKILAALLRNSADSSYLSTEERITAEALCLDIEVQAGIRVMPTTPEV